MESYSMRKHEAVKTLKKVLFVASFIAFLVLGFITLSLSKPGKFEDLLPDGDPVKSDYLKFEKEFDHQGKIYLLIKKAQGMLKPEEIHQINQEWKAQLRLYPQITKIETLSERKVVQIKKDEFLVENLKEQPSQNFPFWQDLHVGRSQSTLLISISLKKMDDMSKNLLIEQLLSSTNSSSNPYQHFWVGVDVSNYFFFKEQQKIQNVICPLVLFIMSLFLLYLFRDIKVAALFATNIIVIYILTGIIISFLENGISPYSSFALFFTLVISTSDLVHLFYSWTGNDSAEDDKKRHHCLKRCFYTSLTTVAAFFTFMFNSNASIQELGLYSAVGGSIAFVITFYFFPWSLKLWTNRNRLHLRSYPMPIFFPKKLNVRKEYILYFLTLLSLAIIPFTIIDEDPYKKFSEYHYLNQGIKLLKEDFGFVGPIDVIFECKSHQINQEVLHELNQIEGALKLVPGVTKVKSLSSLLSGTFYRTRSKEEIPFKDIDAFSQIMMNYQLVNYYFNPIIKKMRIEIFVNTTSARDLTLINEKVKQKIRSEINTNQLFHPKIVGYPQVILSLYQNFKQDFFASFSSSFIFTFLCFLIMLKSFKKASIAMIPNIFPIIVCGGIIGLLSYLFHFALESNLLIIYCVVMGIAVDDSIHFLAEVEDQASRHDLNKALVVADKEVGDPLKAITYILIASFMSFIFSDIVLFAQMGFLIAFSLWLALLGDLWLMPHLILKYRKHWN
jgi:predicted RND superfamily exporter protein